MQCQWMKFIHLRVIVETTFDYNGKCCLKLKWFKMVIVMVLTSMFVTENVVFNLDLFIMVVFSCKENILITKKHFFD